MDAQTLCEKLSSTKFNFSNELELQSGIEELLKSLIVDYQKEVILTPKDRIDFLVGKIGIEVKVDGAANAVIRQLWRYAQQETIDELILVTTRSVHKYVPGTILGKTVYIVHLLTFL